MSNPLLDYKKEQRLSWPLLRKKTGVALETLRWITRKDSPTQLSTMTFSTYMRIKATTGVDLLKWFEDNVKVLVTTHETEEDLFT